MPALCQWCREPVDVSRVSGAAYHVGECPVPIPVGFCWRHGDQMLFCRLCLGCLMCCSCPDGHGKRWAAQWEAWHPGHAARLQAFTDWINAQGFVATAGIAVCRWVVCMADDFPECLESGDTHEALWHHFRCWYLDWQREGFIDQ
jgi:hypothetical protein